MDQYFIRSREHRRGKIRIVQVATDATLTFFVACRGYQTKPPAMSGDLARRFLRFLSVCIESIHGMVNSKAIKNSKGSRQRERHKYELFGSQQVLRRCDKIT